MNISGQLVQEYTTSKQKINIEQMESGIYFVIVEIDNIRSVQKLIVNKAFSLKDAINPLIPTIIANNRKLCLRV